VATVGILDEPKVDCHVHVFEPARFPYEPDTFYAPSGPEIGTAAHLLAVFDTYGVANALLVGPNSGYGTDNRCLLDALARAPGRLRGMAVVPNDIPTAELGRLKAAGIVGVTLNAALFGVDHYRDAVGLLADLTVLDMFADVQVERDQLVDLMALLRRSEVRIVVDHCGRPAPGAGFDQAGFRGLLDLAGTGRACVKLSGLVKYSAEPYPHRDAWPYVRALIEAFGPGGCVWGSDWPFLRAPERIDYGPLLTLFEHLVPDPAARRAVLWDTPRRLFGFDAPASAGQERPPDRATAGRGSVAEAPMTEERR
jgi:predicted TIM-barrel fold metal-dependent hydrolase